MIPFWPGASRVYKGQGVRAEQRTLTRKGYTETVMVAITWSKAAGAVKRAAAVSHFQDTRGVNGKLCLGTFRRVAGHEAELHHSLWLRALAGRVRRTSGRIIRGHALSSNKGAIAMAKCTKRSSDGSHYGSLSKKKIAGLVRSERGDLSRQRGSNFIHFLLRMYQDSYTASKHTIFCLHHNLDNCVNTREHAAQPMFC